MRLCLLFSILLLYSMTYSVGLYLYKQTYLISILHTRHNNNKTVVYWCISCCFLITNNTAISLCVCIMYACSSWQTGKYILRVSYTNLKVVLSVHINLYIYSVYMYPFTYILDNTDIKMLPFWGTYWTVFIPPALFLIIYHLLFTVPFIFAVVAIYRNLIPSVFFFPLGLFKDSAIYHLSHFINLQWVSSLL